MTGGVRAGSVRTMSAVTARARPDGAPEPRPGRSPRAVVAFRAAAAVIAVYVLSDAVLAPEPGTGAADHLPGAPLALGLLLAAGFAFPRLPAGGGAILALVIGPAALAAGIADGILPGLAGRVAGDDLAAFAAAVAGAVLIVLGCRLLWRSRRTDGPRGRRLARRALRSAGALVFAWLVLAPIVLAIVATHTGRKAVPAADLGAARLTVTLRTSDGLRLAGWYVPSRNGAAVLVAPGRSGTVPHARLLIRHGYGVLLLDSRGRSESDGDPDAYGWTGLPDVDAGVDFLAGRTEVRSGRIGGLGLSVGGELLLGAAAADPRLGAVVSEGAGVRSLAEHLHTPGVGAAQRWVTPWIVQTAALAVLSGAGPPPDLVDLVARMAPRRVLLIQAEHGAGGEELNAVYARAAGPSATLWIAGGGHTGALAAEPRAYARRVVGFFDRPLRGDLRTRVAGGSR